MRRLVFSQLLGLAFGLVVSSSPASAQPLGTFSWQMAPNCNIVTISVTQNASIYTLDGFDTQCGAAQRAPLNGVATPNPNGTIGLGMTIVNTPGGEPTHVDAVVNLATLNGTWSDSGGNSGSFVFNGPGGGVRRPTGEMQLSGIAAVPAIFARRAGGSINAPTSLLINSQLFAIDARGFDGVDFDTSADASFRMTATQNWTNTAHGTRIQFATTANDTISALTRMVINDDGNVGIGTITPVAPLDVDGNIRIGSAGIGCVQDRDGTVIAGICASDERFKRDITPFSPMLDKVAAIRPVHFYWRDSDFPARAFGKRESFGLIAQEVEQVLPELVSVDAQGYRAVNYSQLPLVALQAIKELKEQNDVLRAESEAFKAQAAAFERRLIELESRITPR